MMEIISFIWTVVGTLLGAVGVMFSINAFRKEKRLKSISWNDVNLAAKRFYRKLNKMGFTPDIIYSPGQKGGLIAKLLEEYYNVQIPIVTGFFTPRGSFSLETNSFEKIATSKWDIFIPDVFDLNTNKKDYKILIVDDFVMTGDSLQTFKNYLINLGYDIDNIKSCAIAITSIATAANKAPDLYEKVVSDNDFYFPWGRAE